MEEDGRNYFRSIGTTKFRELLYQTCGIKSVHDYYGMVEQTGSIYIECSHGYLHSSIYSDVIIRNANDFSEVPNGKKGIIQTLSILPTSYPGHSLLTEDEGLLKEKNMQMWSSRKSISRSLEG